MKSIKEMSIDTQTIYERLLEMKVNEIVTYQELSQLIGRDIQSSRYILATARKKARNENRIVIDCISGKGIKRSDDETIAQSGEAVIKHIRRAARKGKKVLHCVQEFDQLSNESKIKHNAMASILGVFDLMTKPQNMKVIEAGVSTISKELPTAKTLDLFRPKPPLDNDNAK